MKKKVIIGIVICFVVLATIILGNLINNNAGVIKLVIQSKIPEFLSIPIATNNPISVGKIFKLISTPSKAPFKKISKTGFFSFIDSHTISKITIGIAITEI